MSPADDIKHFLVTRDVTRSKTTVVEFGADYEAAQHACVAAERKLWGRSDLDVVLLGADSLETIKCTHSSYFGRARIVSAFASRKDSKPWSA
jgi:hypothetical protein